MKRPDPKTELQIQRDDPAIQRAHDVDRSRRPYGGGDGTNGGRPAPVWSAIWAYRSNPEFEKVVSGYAVIQAQTTS